MAENIKKTPTSVGDNEEDPKIVAQRFLNIFHQLHIFGDEKRAVFDKMLMDQPVQVRSAFRQLPGGSILLDYLSEIENGEGKSQEDFDYEDIQTTDISEPKKAGNATVLRGDIPSFSFDTTEFAKILASTLAQSNMQIIKEFQKNIQSSSNKNSNSGVASKVELVADETFTQSIAEALSNAISTSEQKRLEDTKVIANSFLELQENINKMVEQNAQLKVISDGKVSDKTVSAFQFKNVVEDLVKAQTKFLKETSQSQKEELSSIVAAAIKDSVKLSTQSFAETLKQLYNQPTPITYASPEQKKQNISEIENIIKTQGREFYSVIAAALRESQKNSTQSIIKTIENLNASASSALPQTTEEIVKAQTQLFREITKEQNKEFSETIAKALKEGQKQSTEAIIELIKHLPPVVKIDVPQVLQSVVEKVIEPAVSAKKNDAVAVQPATNVVEKTVKAAEVPVNSAEQPVVDAEPKKKKKKKKKKNKAADQADYNLPQDDAVELSGADTAKYDKSSSDIFVEMQQEPEDSAASWGFVRNEKLKKQKVPEISEGENLQFEEFEESVPADDELQNDEYITAGDGTSEEEYFGEEGKDWEWDYEEITDENDAAQEAGDNDISVDEVGDDDISVDEFAPKELSDEELLAGEEGKDWEWDYEEIEDEAPEPEENEIEFEESTDEPEDNEPEQEENIIAERSEIVIPEDFRVLLVGLDADKFEDPYIENVDDMY